LPIPFVICRLLLTASSGAKYDEKSGLKLSSTEFPRRTIVLSVVSSLVTPAVSNEARANYSNQRIGLEFAVDDFGGAMPIPDSVLFPAGDTSANANFGLYIPGAGNYNSTPPGNVAIRST
jgi:hypothetical protein